MTFFDDQGNYLRDRNDAMKCTALEDDRTDHGVFD